MGRDLIAFLTGAVIGVAAGLLGVGGGEFRIPALWFLLNKRIRSAAAVNLFVGTFTVIASLARRWNTLVWNESTVNLAIALVIASLAGGILGARKATILPLAILRRVVEFYLIVVGVWMLYEATTHTERILFEPRGWTLVAVAFLIAFFVSVFSAAVGVAGGELRIPALLYLCAIPLKEAGTFSLVASLPTVAAGALVHRNAGELRRGDLLFAIWMAAGSIVGVLCGVYFLGAISTHLLKGIFGAILLAAAIAIESGGRLSAPEREERT